MSDRFLLWPMTDDPALPEDAWLDEYWRSNTVPGCRHEPALRPDTPTCTQPTSVNEIHLSSLGNDRAFNFCRSIGLPLIHSELRDILLPHLGVPFTVGKVILNGHESPLHSVLTASRWVILRGGPRSYFYPCPTCHQWLYEPMGSWYLLEQDVPSESVALTCGGGGLIVTDEIARDVAANRWKDVVVRKMRIRPKPIDGFPETLQPVPAERQRRPAFLEGK